jgi:cytidylate kinase
MQTGHIDIITVSREFGAGGSDFARELGERLGWRILDHDLIQLVAQRLQLQEATVERLDEHPPNWLARVASALLIAPPDAPVGIDTSHLLHMDTVAAAAQSVIRDAAQQPPLIIVGHSAQNIFATRAGTLHIRLIAPLEKRVQRLIAQFGWDAATASARARRIDADRDAYAQRYHNREWRDPLSYDLIINTGRVSIHEAVALVERKLR